MPGLFIYNATAGAAAKFPPAQLLAELPADTRLHEFAEGDDPGQLARDAIADGVQWIAVAGGDGTVESVAAALIGAPVPLGVIPCGTYNNFARSVGLPIDPLEAARLISAGATKPMDVGFVNDRPFFECVGVGLDAALFPLGEEIKSGGLAKWLALFRRAIAYPRQTFELELDRPLREALVPRSGGPARPARRWRKWLRHDPLRTVRLRALMITVSNGPYYGMNFAIAPDATVTDGQFTITIFKRYSKLELWWHFFSIRAGRRIYAPRVVTLAAKCLRIGGPATLHVHADGNPLELWPLRIDLRPGSLQVFAIQPPDVTRK